MRNEKCKEIIDTYLKTVGNNNNIQKVLTSNEIIQIQDFFKDVDSGSIGGHNNVHYKCILIFRDENDVTFQFWGLVFGRYEERKNDLFLLWYEPHKNSTCTNKFSTFSSRKKKFEFWKAISCRK